MDITLKQLEIFQAVIVAGSITKASRRIGLSQPSISQQLAKLEDKLGSQLIQRNRTGIISLTPAGEYWAGASRELLQRLEGAIDEHVQRFADSNVFVRMGVTPTLRGRFAAAASRIAWGQPGFVKFELRFALTSAELVEQLRLHRINFAIVAKAAIEEDRSSFHIADLFEDVIGWIVPACIPEAEIRRTVSRRPGRDALAPALRGFVDVDASPLLRAQAEEWYRLNLPGAAQMFTTNTYATAVDLVAEGLASTLSPLSLLPNLSSDTRAKIRIFPIRDFVRPVVLAMPKHLYTLPAYASVFRQITDFCRTEYNAEMVVAEEPERMPIAS